MYIFALFAIFSNFSEKTFLRIDIYDLCIFPQTIFYNNQAELFLKKVFLSMTVLQLRKTIKISKTSRKHLFLDPLFSKC